MWVCGCDKWVCMYGCTCGVMYGCVCLWVQCTCDVLTLKACCQLLLLQVVCVGR